MKSFKVVESAMSVGARIETSPSESVLVANVKEVKQDAVKDNLERKWNKTR